ncbi:MULTISPECIES: biofilm development regulator YmgB/AriR family protein [Atlantibacter]|uniref:biofilm development regulator YmgB/AriR family protein n=1 Tax=Atlantibacter TaxID=1903434 RepID=UPI002583008F|nr:MULTISPECIES: biofilm development regulator YmgB/AriR family protein [Atlantibacter]MDU1951442.1 biofilm development regulator YmgB/AriR family protein [Atlantibacter hermannii]MDW4576775.1 biofilm development regulator YmgB/AriR family protein [Atlantibacter hermannii]
MFKNDSDPLVDTVIGEAVIELLESDSAVSFDELIAKLQESLSHETDSDRQTAYRTAIGGIHKFRNQPVIAKRPAQGHERDALLRSLLNHSETTKH